MKRVVILLAVIAIGVAAMIYGQRHHAEAPVSPAPLLHVIGDTEHDLTRVPMQLTRLSDEEEVRIGNEVAAPYLRQASTLPVDPEMERYVSQVGARLAMHAHRKLPYRFHYLADHNYINAFSLPGGDVFVGEGLVRLMRSEDELASVLGHELEHIDHYHCAERAQIEARLRHLPLGELAALPIQLFQAGYSKEQELEADREGTRLAVLAGYSPYGMLSLLERMESLHHREAHRAKTPQGELSEVALATLVGYFQSHPPAAERIAQIQRLIADSDWQDRTAQHDLKFHPG
jgi:predicted Zn-dependent protease